MHVALLRGVNLAGHRKVSMADLRQLFTDLGFDDARTLLQSGNVVFDGGARAPARLEQLFEKEIDARIGLQTDFFVRTGAELKQTIARNPYADIAKKDPAHLVVVFMKDAPPAAGVKTLRAAIVGREAVEARGREAYIVFPDGIGRSRLTHALIERHLGTRGTGRNWNTVTKLAALAC